MRKKLIAYLTSVSLLLGTSACMHEDIKKKNTLLDDARLVLVDNEYKVFKKSEFDYHKNAHVHYVDLMTGVQYVSNDNIGKCYDEVVFYKELKTFDYIINYMNQEEIELYKTNSLKDEEILNIINRAIDKIKNIEYKLKKTL